MLFLALVQGTPIPALAALGAYSLMGETLSEAARLLALLSGVLLLVRVLLQRALAPSYARTGLPFWLSATADPVAAARILVSTVRTPTQWRGRTYPQLGKV